MTKFVAMMILSLIITQILHLLFSEETAGLKKREEKVFKVILNQGVIGCISQEKFDNVQNLYTQNNQNEIDRIVNDPYATEAEIEAAQAIQRKYYKYR